MANRYEGLETAVVLITGAARGLGAALAHSFAEQGSRLVLTDIDAEGISAVAGDLALSPDRISLIPADLVDTAAAERLIEASVDAFGRLDVLVNNAALMDGVALEEITADLFDRVLAVNLRAPLFLSRAALAVMKAQGGGRIVNVASMAARTGGAYPTVFCYAASKGGLLALTKSFARVGAPDGVLVNAVLPSNIDSPMLWGPFAGEAVKRTLAAVPLGRPAQGEEVAELVLWLASNSSSYVTGASWDINGGWFMT
jgi:3-oxoacyl-[acyl-carrier protein] reductase